MLSVDSNYSIIQCLETLASQLKTIGSEGRGERERLRSQLVPRTGLLQEIHTGLATLYNICQPIQRLPIEILSDIFKQTFPPFETPLDGLLRGDKYFSLPPKTNAYICHAICLSSVCRFWRDVVLLHPTFWAVIETHESRSSHLRKSIDYFIPRTLNVPLQILDYNYSAWHILQSESRRLRRYLLALDDTDLPVSFSPTPICTPALECLSIALPQKCDQAINPLELFGPELPGLQRLLLLNVPSSADIQVAGLTHLALCECNNPYIDESQFLDLLRSCPLLQSLIIQHWLPYGCWSGEELHDDREVCLNHLAQLNVTQDSMDSVMSLVSHLTFSPTTSVIMTADQTMILPINPSTIPSGVPDFGNKSTLLLIRDPPSTSHDSTGNEEPVLISAYNEGDCTKLMLFCYDRLPEYDPPSTEIPPCFASILFMLNPTHVENIFLGEFPRINSPTLARMFQMIPSVKYFSFHCYDYRECLGFLWQVEATQSLETIRIVYDHCTPYGWNQQNQTFMKDLGAMVTHRARSGRRLKAIYFDIIQAPNSKQGDKVREEHTIFLDGCNRFRRNIDVLETQYHSSQWLGDAGLHAEYEYTSWVRDWDLGSL